MNLKRGIGIVLILISGAIGWTNTITGGVIGVSSSPGLNILTVLIFIAGMILVLTENLEGRLHSMMTSKQREKYGQLSEGEREAYQKSLRRYQERNMKRFDKSYYSKRVKELLSHEGDAWIALGEVPGVVKELNKRGYIAEHRVNEATLHLSTGVYKRKEDDYENGNANVPYRRILHIEISGRGKKKGITKHLLVSRDPSDERIINQAGIDDSGERIKRIPSKVYSIDELGSPVYPEIGIPKTVILEKEYEEGRKSAAKKRSRRQYANQV
ncbi:MAG: hypothetical protein KKE50_03945 [Nanoarchaeota archaeon]|nr:hypothetical protein [Nanoarchaeota archaeon]